MEQKKININAVYVTYQGEVNVRGIGAPVIFLRLQGCHLRCYKETIGCLCDTPEALDTKVEKNIQTLDDLCEQLCVLKETTGIDFICFTGGDPLYYDKETLKELFIRLCVLGFTVSVETSGTLDVRPYILDNVHFVLDYKLLSAGIKASFFEPNLRAVGKAIVKFVIYDENDYSEMVKVATDILSSYPNITIAVGLYWNTPFFSYEELTKYLLGDGLVGKVHINFQAHKLATLLDKTPVENVKVIEIPKLL